MTEISVGMAAETDTAGSVRAVQSKPQDPRVVKVSVSSSARASVSIDAHIVSQDEAQPEARSRWKKLLHEIVETTEGLVLAARPRRRRDRHRPGYWLLKLARKIHGRDAYEAFEIAVGELLAEHAEAKSEGDNVRAHYVVLRLRWQFLRCWFSLMPSGFLLWLLGEVLDHFRSP